MVSRNPGQLARATSLIQLGGGLAGSYLAYQLQRAFLTPEERKERGETLSVKQAKRIREKLQEIRGPAMKIGQALSMQTHLFDSGIIEELSSLQMLAPPMHTSLMRAQFKGAFGKNPEEVFKSFDVQPFAAASFGQVHWAVTNDGEEVVVKIQYPAIREAVATDFRMLRAVGLAARFTGHLSEAVVAEAQRGVMEETNYEKEARNLEFFRKHLAPLSYIEVPRVHRELSCDRVLTMSRVGGLRMQEFLKTKPSPELRDRIGAGLMRLFFFQLFRVQALHADPHPGNYLFRPDGSIGVVDFGCVKYLKPDVAPCYAQFWSREWDGNKRIFAEIIRVVFGPTISPDEPRVLRAMRAIKEFYDEFHPLTEPPRTLDMGDSRFMDGLNKLAKVLLKGKFLSPEFLFLSRTESGFCNLLHTLRARVPTTQIAREWMPRTSG